MCSCSNQFGSLEVEKILEVEVWQWLFKGWCCFLCREMTKVTNNIYTTCKKTKQQKHIMPYILNLSQLTFHQNNPVKAIPRNPGIASKIYYKQTSWPAICKVFAVFSWNKSSKLRFSSGLPRAFQGELHSCSTLQDLRADGRCRRHWLLSWFC